MPYVSFLFIFALFLIAVACLLAARIKVEQRYNNAQLFELLAQGTHVCNHLPCPSRLSLNCGTLWGYSFCIRYVRGLKPCIAYSERFLADTDEGEVQEILRVFLKSVKEQQTH